MPIPTAGAEGPRTVRKGPRTRDRGTGTPHRVRGTGTGTFPGGGSVPGPAGSPFSLGAPGLGFRARGAGAARRGRGDRGRSGSRPGGRSCVSPASPGTGAGLERRTGPARDAAPWRSLLARRRVFNGTVPLASLPPRRSTGPAHLRSGPGAGVRRVLPILGAKPQRGGS